MLQSQRAFPGEIPLTDNYFYYYALNKICSYIMISLFNLSELAFSNLQLVLDYIIYLRLSQIMICDSRFEATDYRISHVIFSLVVNYYKGPTIY